MKLAINGALGQMGRLIGKLAIENGFKVTSAIDNKSNFGADYFEILTGKKADVFITSEITEKPDVLIDFSHPNAIENICKNCVELKCPILTGTTGFTDNEIELLSKTAEFVPVLFSANFSLGVAVVRKLIETAAKILYPADFDIEITEAHHRKKVDAPSGTAIELGKSAAKGANLNYPDAFNYDRCGNSDKRKTDEIGFSVIRGGTIVGEHTATFAGEQEIVEISHRALNREIFARGALQASKWLIQQQPGFYTIDDFLQSIINK